jgi:hypothetical protein
LIDGLKTISFHNGILRIECIAAGPKGEERPSGTLLIPGAQAGPILKALVEATQELSRRQKEQAPTAGNA